MYKVPPNFFHIYIHSTPYITSHFSFMIRWRGAADVVYSLWKLKFNIGCIEPGVSCFRSLNNIHTHQQKNAYTAQCRYISDISGYVRWYFNDAKKNTSSTWQTSFSKPASNKLTLICRIGSKFFRREKLLFSHAWVRWAAKKTCHKMFNTRVYYKSVIQGWACANLVIIGDCCNSKTKIQTTAGGSSHVALHF